MGVKRKIKRSSSPDTMPIQEAFNEFITEREAKNLSKSTLRNYIQSFDYFMEFFEFDNDTLLQEVNQSLFYHWMNDMKLEGVRPTSINHYLRDCRTFFNWAMDKGYLPQFKIPMMEGQEEAPKMFSEDELSLLLEKPKPGDSFTTWRTWAIVNWVLATGNRASTIIEVRIEDIDFNKKEITLSHTKNKKASIIPLSPSLENSIKEYMRKFEIEEWLFPNVGVEQLTTGALQHSFAKYCKDRGCERTNIHGLRHNFAKLWIKNDGDHFKLQKMLGHQTLAMTSHYVKLFSEDLKEDFEKFNPLDTLKRNSKRTNKIVRK
jgi:integrase/recombinase XerD